MREIKFRVWDKDMKRMHVCGEDIHDAIQFLDGNAHYYNLQNGCGSYGSDASYILMQYTGLKDASGREIYESDIVNVAHVMVENIPPYRAKIEWDKYRFALVNLEFERLKWNTTIYPMHNLNPFGLDLEVIGNIYENPELLEVNHERSDQ